MVDGVGMGRDGQVRSGSEGIEAGIQRERAEREER